MEIAFMVLLLIATIFAGVAFVSLYLLKEARDEMKSLNRIIKLYRN
jgi:hypothetical protein